MNCGHRARLAFHDLQVHQDFAGALFLTGQLVAVQVHQAHVFRFHEALGNQRRRAERHSFRDADGDVAAVAIDVGATP